MHNDRTESTLEMDRNRIITNFCSSVKLDHKVSLLPSFGTLGLDTTLRNLHKLTWVAADWQEDEEDDETTGMSDWTAATVVAGVKISC